MDIYSELIIVGFILLIFSIFMSKVKPNLFYGVRTSETLSDPEVWKKTNKLGSILFSIVSLIFILLNLIFYLSNSPTSNSKFSLIFLLFGILSITFYLVFYSKKLLKEKGKKREEIIITNSFVYLMIISSIALIVIGSTMPFIPPNGFIGIRIEKTLSDTTIWKRVNTISGIGLTLLGLMFSYLFFKIIKIYSNEKKSKVFFKYLYYFLLFLILWLMISTLVAYV
ncbi:MAG: SdpI family protein [Caldisericia bacterium]|nr:SdpI family protein [Caldisericia bacterium]